MPRVVVLVCMILGAINRARGAEPPADPAPRQVTIGLYTTAIPEVDIKVGTFTIDMYLWVTYRGDDAVENLEIANGEVLAKTELERVTRDGLTYVCWRVKATVHEHFSLADYPFDRQRLELHFEHGSLEAHNLVIEPDLASYRRSSVAEDRWGLRDDVAIAEYDIVRTSWSQVGSRYQTDFGSPYAAGGESHYSRAVFAIDVARSFWPYCYKILIPLFVVLAIAYLVFFLPPREVQTASSLAITALLSCVAMNLTVSSNLPDVGYLVASDKFFICTYVLIFIALAETVWTYAYVHAGKHVQAGRIERVFRWGFPVAALGAFVYLGAAAVG